MSGPDIKKIKALEQRMEQMGIAEKEIELKFIKASGRGGQKVNKTSSAVFVKHVKTGLTAKCSASRSQHLNRFLAIRLLLDKIENASRTGKAIMTDKAARIRKQKQRRKARTRKRLSDQPDDG